jgi:6-phospho-3-hexuloisomerase
MITISNYIDSLSSELKAVFARIKEEEVDRFVGLVIQAKRIFIIGAGRVGTSSRAFAMRLTHLGKLVYWLPDDTTPSNGRGDLLIANSGSGTTLSTYDLARKAKECGTMVATITANRKGKIAQLADAAIHLPAQTYHVDRSNWTSILPLGSQFELSLWILHDFIALQLMEKMNYTEEMLVENHRLLE